MRQFLMISIIVLSNLLIVRGQDTTVQAIKHGETVSFQTKIDIEYATKDGIYLNGYVVNIPYDKLERLTGKTVRISGKVTIVKGTKHYTDGEIRQGRYEDSKHIEKPKIQVVRS